MRLCQHVSISRPTALVSAGLPCLTVLSTLQGLLPDGLHPNAAGMDLIAECLEASLTPLLRPAANNTAPRLFTGRIDSKHAQLPC